jgi:NADPH-dependent 7-cyano-7-deazaguanine reductase QueF
MFRSNIIVNVPCGFTILNNKKECLDIFFLTHWPDCYIETNDSFMNIIMNVRIELMEARFIEVWGKEFTPRGGILIDLYTNYGRSGTKYEQMAEQR